MTTLPLACTTIGMRVSDVVEHGALGDGADVVAGAVEGRVELAVSESHRRDGKLPRVRARVVATVRHLRRR